MVRTRVGYSGGTKKSPTYHDLGNHSETIQVDFDPAQISYGRLLDVFWKAHNPVSKSWSSQYRTILFYHNEEQKRLALETRDREAIRIQGQVKTEILPASEFYWAEDYHQKYYLQQDPLLSGEFHAIYPSFRDLVNSTAAARVNGYTGGHGNLSDLQAELASLGLSPEGSQRLSDIVSAFHR